MLQARYGLRHLDRKLTLFSFRKRSTTVAPKQNVDQPSEEDQRAARLWLSRFNSGTIPRNLCNISFSRSSGPGGQNVNK